MIDDPVRIVEARLRPYELRLVRPWRSAAGEIRSRRGWLLSLTDADGGVAVGECAPLPEAGTETRATAEARLECWRDRLAGRPLCEAWESLESIPSTPAVRCAVETALLGLAARRCGLPIARLLNPAAGPLIRVNANLGTADDGLPNRARDAVGRGFRVLKVKLGIDQPEAELRRLEEAAARLPDGTGFRLDANGAWDEALAIRWLDAIVGLPVESVEEPLVGADPVTLAKLQHHASCPLAVDESLPDLIARGLERRLPVRRVVIKPMVSGGARPALRLAAATGRQVVVTTTVDAAPGRWMAAHLAAALDNGASHGLDTGSWLAEDLGTGPVVRHGECRVFEEPEPEI